MTRSWPRRHDSPPSSGSVSGSEDGSVPRSEDGSEDDGDLPVVARLVVEIRSDGRRTIARGAMEDIDGQRVAVEARSTTPWALAKQLAGALWKVPRLRRRGSLGSLRSLLPGSRRERRGDDDD